MSTTKLYGGRRRYGGEEEEEKEEKEEVNLSQSAEPGTAQAALQAGRRRHSRRHHRHRKTLRVPKGTHVKAKTLRRLLKSKGLKVSGKKSTLRARARKAHLIRGGGQGMLMASGPSGV